MDDLLDTFKDHRVLCTGPSGPKAFRAMCDYFTAMIQQGVTSETLPEGNFIGKIADRIAGPTIKDCLIQVEGRKGSGKSTISLEFAYQLSKALARRLGGTPERFFTLNNVIVLSDARTIFKALQSIPEFNILILDDLGIGANNRESQSKNNISLGNILAISRTKRWTIITTSPLRTQTDKNVRLFSDVVIRTRAQIPRVDDKPGFNIVKVHYVELNPITQNEITPNLIARDKDNKKRKVNYYGVLYPPAHLAKPYDEMRVKATDEVIRKIIDNGSFNGQEKKVKINKAQQLADTISPEAKAAIFAGVSTRKLSGLLGCSEITATQVRDIINRSPT